MTLHLKTLKKYIFAILTIVGFFILNGPTAGLAMDEGGCLTCHQYPGLVTLEKSDKFKVLHIDEGKFIDSPHGKVDCRKCHTQVKKVPHTGETRIECTTGCHLDDKEKITAMQSSLSTFHEGEKYSITGLQNKSSCRGCHTLYPHSENNKVRALVNMHTGFMLCEVCHLKKENLKNLTYDWKKPESVKFSREPYGTYYRKTRGTESLISRILRIFSPQENQTERTGRVEYFLISRIAVFSVEKGGNRLLMNTRDTRKAIKFKDREKSLDPEEKEKELKYFHKDIARKEISVACNECHSPNGILDFKKLGFDEKKTKDLQYLNIKSLVTKYEIFYFPNLFER